MCDGFGCALAIELMPDNFPSFPAALALMVAGFFVVGYPSKATAEIVWKQTVVELRADAKSSVLDARFPFSNAGATAVDITQAESSCGCTVVNLAKRHYEPGESGEIVARYTVGSQMGVQKKTVLVETNDGHPPTTLTLEIHLPEIVRMQPSFLRWKHGEPPAAKKITLEILQEVPAEVVTVRSSAVGFDVEAKPLIPGRKFELTVHPLNTDQRQFSTLTVRCRFGDEEKDFFAYASVQTAETKD